MKDAERIAELEAALRRSELLVEQLQAQLNLRRRKQLASSGVDEREAFESRYELAKAVVFEAEHNRYVPRYDSHWQRQCAEAITPLWRAWQARAALSELTA